ncbi:MAG: hypothetical protein HC883_03000, partial [Bdellovibrionaceae bacterium]|nr:hypothetical protein [Pseudobdellovibrionaceae bacterium]
MSGRRSLKPLSLDMDREVPRFGVCDIESYKWTQFRVCGLGWKTYDDDGKETGRRYENFFTMEEFCEFLFSNEFPYNTVFAHFGGVFDFSFALKEYFESYEKFFLGEMIPRGSGLLCFDVSTFRKVDRVNESVKESDVLGRDPEGWYMIRDRKITFRDSAAMLPFGLASLTDNFKVEHKKKDIDFDTFEKVTDEMMEYLQYDVWGLYEVLEKYFSWDLIKGSGSAFTVASQALRVFRTYLKKPISSINPIADDFVRSSYFGGRTEVFKPFFQQCDDNLIMRSYDVNSLYPAVMREFDYPGSFHFETKLYIEDRPGFYDVDIEVPEMYIPPLGVRFKGIGNRLIFPTGRFRGVWSTVELNYARSLGCKVLKVHKGMVFRNGGFIFKDYIENLYARRKAAEKYSVEDVLCKLLMNSLYGRFGLNLLREMLEFDCGQMGVIPHMEIQSAIHDSVNEGGRW